MSSLLENSSIAPSVADTFRDRRPPWSEDAEQAVLGAMIMDRDAILRAAEFSDDTLFYREGHRRIFRAIVALNERGTVVDVLTLADELALRGELDAAGGKEYLSHLLDVVPTSANVEYHARIVREKGLIRRLIETSTELVSEAYDGRRTSSELLDHAEQRILQINTDRGREGFSRIKELLWPAMERIEQLAQGGGAVTGVPSGFHDLDRLTLGFQPSELSIVAARPSMGKTAFVLNVAQNAAFANTSVALFSLEMAKEQLVTRMLAAEGWVDAQKLRSGKLSDDDFRNLGKASGILGSLPIWIDDTPALSALEIRARARRLKAENNIGLIVIDYLQLIQGPADSENRQQEISYI